LIINTTANIIEKSLLRTFRPSAGAIVRNRNVHNKLLSIILAVVFMTRYLPPLKYVVCQDLKRFSKLKSALCCNFHLVASYDTQEHGITILTR